MIHTQRYVFDLSRGIEISVFWTTQSSMVPYQIVKSWLMPWLYLQHACPLYLGGYHVKRLSKYAGAGIIPNICSCVVRREHNPMDVELRSLHEVNTKSGKYDKDGLHAVSCWSHIFHGDVHLYPPCPMAGGAVAISPRCRLLLAQ